MSDSSRGSELDQATPSGTEVERRFLVDRLPSDLDGAPRDQIAQGYLALDPAGAQVRVRRRGYHTLLTIKTGRGLERTEEELVIDQPRFERLWACTQGRRIEKTRYRLPLDGGLTLELDVFAGALTGLVMAEVEFASVDAALAFQPPAWLGPEVTEDRRYENSRLARDGQPDRTTDRDLGLQAGEPVLPSLIQVMQAQLREAATALQDPDPTARAKGIHRARKAFKRGRAIARVARPGLGDDVAARENAALREAGQRLSGTRDADVLVETLDRLVARKRTKLDEGELSDFRAVLVAERDAAHDRARADQGEITGVLEHLDAARTHVAGWTLGERPAAELAEGLDRVLRKGRRALKAAERSEGEHRTEALHELRKRSKDLWHAAELLEVAAPGQMRALQERAHRLADYLGDDHDLAVLAGRVSSAPAAVFPSSSVAGALQDEIARRRRKLETKAIDLARDLHGSRHRDLVRAVQRLNAPSSSSR